MPWAVVAKKKLKFGSGVNKNESVILIQFTFVYYTLPRFGHYDKAF